MKVVINTCFGGFGLSNEATQWLWDQGVKDIGTPAKEYFGGPGSKYYEVNGDNDHWQDSLQKALERWRSGENRFGAQFTPDEQFCLYIDHNFPRTHPKLIECIEKFGEAANGSHAELKIIEIPDGTEYEIDEYDGNEHIAEVHRTWR